MGRKHTRIRRENSNGSQIPVKGDIPKRNTMNRRKEKNNWAQTLARSASGCRGACVLKNEDWGMLTRSRCCCCCCCCLHIKSRSGLYSVLSNIRTGPTDADAFRGHKLTTHKGYTYQKEIKGPRKVNTRDNLKIK